jgi:hypothetical protein
MEQVLTNERLEFVRRMMAKYKFKTSGHPYQVIRDWLIRELLTKIGSQFFIMAEILATICL